MAELQQALLKWIRYKDVDHGKLEEMLDNVAEEMADVEIMLHQLEEIFGAPIVWRRRKLYHLAELVGMSHPERGGS